ncbi:MAG TPA: chemotaxis protein CheW [Oculatellaceae cyanobacterium]
MLDNDNSFLIFELAGQKFALPALNIEKVVRACAVLNKDVSKKLCSGFLRVNEQDLPVIDLSAWLSLKETKITPDKYHLVVSLAGNLAVILVDNVYDLMNLPMLAGKSVHQPSSKYTIYGLEKFSAFLIQVDQLLVDTKHLFSQAG